MLRPPVCFQGNGVLCPLNTPPSFTLSPSPCLSPSLIYSVSLHLSPSISLPPSPSLSFTFSPSLCRSPSLIYSLTLSLPINHLFFHYLHLFLSLSLPLSFTLPSTPSISSYFSHLLSPASVSLPLPLSLTISSSLSPSLPPPSVSLSPPFIYSLSLSLCLSFLGVAEERDGLGSHCNIIAMAMEGKVERELGRESRGEKQELQSGRIKIQTALKCYFGNTQQNKYLL